MSRGKKVLIGLGVVAALVVAGSMSVRNARGQGTDVRLETVERRDLVELVTANGNIRARRSVDISADVMGRIVELNVDEGDDVTEGQVLLRIDPTTAAAALNQGRATLSQMQAQAKREEANYLRAERDLERMRSLYQRDSLLVSRQQVEQAETDFEVNRALFESARYGVENAQAALAKAQEDLAKTTIRAPMTGKVTRLNVEQGETAVIGTMNNPGSLLLTVSDLSVIEAVMEVDETDVPEIALGDSATVELDAFPDTIFTGRVTEIGNSAVRPPGQTTGGGQSQTIDFEVVITLDDPSDELRPDLSATAEVIVDRSDDVLSVPIIAVTVRDPDEETDGSDSDSGESGDAEDSGEGVSGIEGVFLVEDGMTRFVPVTLGIAGQDYFEITSGLEGGETIVAGPYQAVRTLSDGDPIRESGADESDGPPGSNSEG